MFVFSNYLVKSAELKKKFDESKIRQTFFYPKSKS